MPRKDTLLVDALLAAALAGAAALLVSASTWAAGAVVLQLGPNSAPYTLGFRPGGWEREGTTRYHWTTPSASVRLPVHAAGDGFVLRARVRRHMVEPAEVTFRVEGRAAHRRSIAADTKIAYQIIDIDLPRLAGQHPFVLGIESSSRDPRPLGLAIDWIRLERRGPGRFAPVASLLSFAACLVGIAYAVPRAAGTSRRVALAHAMVLLVVLSLGAGADFLACDRILRDGTVAYAFAAIVAGGVALLLRRRGVSRETAGMLTVLVLAGLALRLVQVLHPAFFYPDTRIHGVVAYVLSREGLVTFLERFTETQYRFSLGLQFQAGHWYAFPYAPGFYFLAWPFISVLQARPETVVSVLAALVNALGILVTFALARLLLRSERLALIAALAHVALPLFLVRLATALFPNLVGHAVDAAAFAFVLVRLERPWRARDVAIVVGLLTMSLLLYTQALLNVAILFALFLAVDALEARTADDRRRQVLLAVTAALALALSFGLFYKRYVPTFLDMQQGRPLAAEEILRDKQRVERSYAEARGEEITPHDEPDPYGGPRFNPLRGARRVIARLFIFYGPFALTILWGLYATAADTGGAMRRWVIAWAALFLILCFGAGALPSPNFLRHAKDLEASAPLFCVAFAWATGAIARRSRWAAVVHVVGFVAFGLWRGYGVWSSTFEPGP